MFCTVSSQICEKHANKDCFIDKFTRLHRGNTKTSAPSFKDVEDVPSKSGTFDASKQAKIF